MEKSRSLTNIIRFLIVLIVLLLIGMYYIKFERKPKEFQQGVFVKNTCRTEKGL